MCCERASRIPLAVLEFQEGSEVSKPKNYSLGYCRCAVRRRLADYVGMLHDGTASAPDVAAIIGKMTLGTIGAVQIAVVIVVGIVALMAALAPNSVLQYVRKIWSQY